MARIYKVPHFQANIEKKKLVRGGNVADPFVVAKAAVMEMPVVTVEKYRPNAAKVPNICQHFGVPCLSFEEFMQHEGWRF